MLRRIVTVALTAAAFFMQPCSTQSVCPPSSFFTDVGTFGVLGSGYLNNQDCDTVISVGATAWFRVEFLSFNTEQNYDFVTMVASLGSQSVQMFRQSGSQVMSNNVIFIQADTLRVNWHTDASVVSSGWELRFHASLAQPATDATGVVVPFGSSYEAAQVPTTQAPTTAAPQVPTTQAPITAAPTVAPTVAPTPIPTPCPAGNFLNNGTCTSCLAGTFSNTTNARVCLPCPLGSWSAPSSSSCSVCDASGFIMLSGADFNLGDIPNTATTTSSASACRDRCAANPDCAYFSWNGGGHWCWLKYPRTNGPEWVGNVVGGAKCPRTWVQYQGFDVTRGTDAGGFEGSVSSVQSAALSQGRFGFVYGSNGVGYFKAGSAQQIANQRVPFQPVGASSGLTWCDVYVYQ